MNEYVNRILDLKLANKQVGVCYIGQEGFIFKYKDKYIAIDPYLSDYVDQNCCQFVKWERLYNPPMDGEDLDFIDLVLLTHTHYDHSDPWTLKKILKVNNHCKFLVSKAEINTYLSYGIPQERLIEGVDNETVLFDNIKIIPYKAAHEEFHVDENGNYKELSYFIDFGVAKFYHAGDGILYEGLCERIKDIDIAFLPINGRDEERNKLDIIGNFDIKEAVELAYSAKAKMIIPMHHDLYKVNYADVNEFIKYADKYKDNLKHYECDFHNILIYER